MPQEAQPPARITVAWLAAWGFRTGQDTQSLVRERIGAALIAPRPAGTARNDGVLDGRKD
jgi:hypothetical protein